VRKPRWIDARALILLHAESLAEHGGLSGLRDEAALHSAQHVLVTCTLVNGLMLPGLQPLTPLDLYEVIPSTMATSALDFWLPVCFLP